MAIDYTKRPKAPASSPAVSPGAVSLSKVSLTKAAPTVSLTKQAGLLRVNLNWNARPAPGSIFRKSDPPVDLDLGCLYEYTDGSKGVVQANGKAFTDAHSFGGGPICRLDGDDRSGTNTQGENLYVDLQQVSSIRRILIFTIIYAGVPNWAAAQGVVTVFPATGPQIEVLLDESDDRAQTCAIVMLENADGALSIRREVKYIRGSQSVLDAMYNWGMRWTAGRK
ncbi:TerD family protein [Actinoplanes palleronii]|uniref:TerD family protein n=1 Tax=Actinoplanes palleronii TaxID=113570 RepID=UPI00194460B5|nr:hypothetical protein [Actinoplanes palleronii]